MSGTTSLKIIIPISLIFVLIFSYCIVLLKDRPGRIRGVSTNFTAAEVISIANAARIREGIAPLHPNPQLMSAAEAKAQAMIATDSWSHDTPNQTPWVFIDQAGYIYMYAGENLAKDFNSPEDVVTAWLNSKSHRDNLLNPVFSDTGVAVVEASYQNRSKTTLVVQYLAKVYVPGDGDLPEQNMTVTKMVSAATAGIRPLDFMIGFTLLCLLAMMIFIFILIKKRLPKLKNSPSSRYWRTK